MGCRLRIPCVEALNLTASLPSGVLGPRFESVLELMMPPHFRWWEQRKHMAERPDAGQNVPTLLFAGYPLRRGGGFLHTSQRLPVALHELRLHALSLFVEVPDTLRLAASFICLGHAAPFRSVPVSVSRASALRPHSAARSR